MTDIDTREVPDAELAALIEEVRRRPEWRDITFAEAYKALEHEWREMCERMLLSASLHLGPKTIQ